MMNNIAFEPILETNEKSISGDEAFRMEVLRDFYICCVSRAASILARKEVLTGKAKFGITGDGKEVAQVALAKALKDGDFRSGYYRDQTLLLAKGEVALDDYFSQLYADCDHDPFSSGRQMMTHFASKLVNEDGTWTSHTDQLNSASDISCTAGQVGRAIGFGLASKKYREMPAIGDPKLTRQGNEITICTIGDGSTSEGAFWESVNAAAVSKIPVAYCVWDDGYAISVPSKYQTVKGSISKAMRGFLIDESGSGIRIYRAKGWDYVGLCEMFLQGLKRVREQHVPALFHVEDMTQPMGHSTSGSHERYKPAERIRWEKEMDCIDAFGGWIIKVGLADVALLEKIRKQAREYARECKTRAWKRFIDPILVRKAELTELIGGFAPAYDEATEALRKLKRLVSPFRSELVSLAREVYFALARYPGLSTDALGRWLQEMEDEFKRKYSTHLYTEGPTSALKVPPVPATYDEQSESVNGYLALNKYFKKAFEKHENLFAFGEDVGRLGDVNQGMMGMQKEFGETRVFDTGIREWTIIGSAIGMSMRGLRPIAEVQYLDYLVYAMAPLVDDLACLSYRSAGIQKAPAIIRTRGHRLEGIWHTGSPIGMLVNSMPGIYLLVPRNLVQAAGMYETMLQSTDPAIIIEPLTGYRLKERVPNNLGEFCVPLGQPEIMTEGTDVTLVTYGICVRIAQQAVSRLAKYGISVELIDVQTLLPFDVDQVILKSLKKTNRIIFMDEDVPGGATAYMMREVLEKQGGFDYLEIVPRTITAKSHRTPYGSDGDYYTKPNVEDVFEEVYDLMRHLEPQTFPIEK